MEGANQPGNSGPRMHAGARTQRQGGPQRGDANVAWSEDTGTDGPPRRHSILPPRAIEQAHTTHTGEDASEDPRRRARGEGRDRVAAPLRSAAARLGSRRATCLSTCDACVCLCAERIPPRGNPHTALRPAPVCLAARAAPPFRALPAAPLPPRRRSVHPPHRAPHPRIGRAPFFWFVGARGSTLPQRSPRPPMARCAAAPAPMRMRTAIRAAAMILMGTAQHRQTSLLRGVARCMHDAQWGSVLLPPCSRCRSCVVFLCFVACLLFSCAGLVAVRSLWFTRCCLVGHGCVRDHRVVPHVRCAGSAGQHGRRRVGRRGV